MKLLRTSSSSRPGLLSKGLFYWLLLLNYELVIEFSMLLFFPIILNWYACPSGRAQRIDLVWPPAR